MASSAEAIFGGAQMSATILRVRDVAASVDWYRDKLGLEPLHQGSDGTEHPIATFAIAGSIVTLWQLPPGEKRRPEENDHNSYVVVVVGADPTPMRATLAARGVDVGDVRRSVNNIFFWFHDPDHNRFEVACPLTPEFQEAARTVAGTEA